MVRTPTIAALAAACALVACSAQAPAPDESKGANSAEANANTVATSGKEEVALANVPAEVLAAAREAQGGFVPAEAEREVRDGRNYFDIGGRLADGSEIEFDIMEEGGRWRVVETQRDMAFSAVPAGVRQAAQSRDPAIAPTRVIESVQQDGLVIYELYSAADGNPQGRKLEVKWNGSEAEILTREWAH